MSFRSKKADVNRIANRFGGGGHIRAAGAVIEKSLLEATKLIEQALLQI